MKVMLAAGLCSALAVFTIVNWSWALNTNTVMNQHGPSKVVAERSALIDAQVNRTTLSGQVRFSAEGPIDNPVIVPENVLNLLKEDPRIKSCQVLEQSHERIPTNWFVGSWLDLNGDDQSDLLVKPVNPCLSGANITPFWILFKTRDGYKPALAIAALAIEILDDKTKGSRDIRSDSATAREVLTTIYRFDGKEYRVWRTSRTKI